MNIGAKKVIGAGSSVINLGQSLVAGPLNTLKGTAYGVNGLL